MVEKKGLHILLAIDGSLHSDAAVKLIERISWLTGSRISVLVVHT